MNSPENRDDKHIKHERPHGSLPRQFGNSALGEIAAFSIAIGAVYMAEKLFPTQTNSFIARLADHLGKWRGAEPETQLLLARKMMDIGIMNVAGASGMTVQFGLRRSRQSAEEKTSFGYEAGRLATGRFFGTITAVSALAFLGIKAPGLLSKMEAGVSEELGANDRSKRFAELLVSNTVQSIGAVAGNASAQLLYDRVIGNPNKEKTK